MEEINSSSSKNRVAALFYSSSNWSLFLLYFVISVLLQFTDLEFVTTERIYQAYEEQQLIEEYGESYADEFSDDLKSMGFDEDDLTDILLDILFDSLFILIESIRLPYLAFCFLLGFEVFQRVKGITFSGLMKVVISAQFVFILQSIIQQAYLLIFVPDRTMEDIKYSKPLSLKSLLGQGVEFEGVSSYFINYIDLFEVGYVLVLAYGISYVFNKQFNQVLSRVGLYYGLSQVVAILFSIFMFEVLLG